MASSSSSRPLNSLEITLHRMILNCKDETATQGDIDGISASKQEKENAINFLLQTGMIKVLKEERTSKILYKGVKVKDAKSKASMDKETQAVLSLIEEAKNEGDYLSHFSLIDSQSSHRNLDKDH
ncbi:hypothetical protein FS842_006836 [Serendipita sp. 407]|nr:hypothetical protein FS842_006836 [Serendipita sp. 407]